MATKFGDFNKEVNDLFTKNTAEGKAVKAAAGEPEPVGFAPLLWKVESKFKASKDKAPLVINPVFESKPDGKSDATINVETFCPLSGTKIKVGLKQDLWASQPTFTYECCGSKAEVKLQRVCTYKALDLVLETKQKVAAANLKIENKDGKDVAKSKATVAAAAPIPGLPINVAAGGQVVIPYGKSGWMDFKQWSAGIRVAQSKCCTSFFTTSALQEFALGAVFDIPGVELAAKPLQGAIQFDYALKTSAKVKKDDIEQVIDVPAKFNVTAGLAGFVPGCGCGSQWKLKVDMKQNLSLSHYVKLGSWGVASTVDVRQKKLGMLLTCE